MEPLRRGAAFTPGATPDVGLMQPPQQTIPAVPTAPAEGAAPQTSAPSGLSQLMTGQFTAAQQNPESSPATAALGQFGDYLSNARRVNVLGQKPSGAEKILNFLAGNQASTADIAQRDAASAAFRDPLVQQHLMNNPDELAMAEKDRLGYAQQTLTPSFRQTMQASVDAHAQAQQDPTIPSDRLSAVANTMLNTGANARQAHAGMYPHEYTKEEFRKAMLGAPLQVISMLFPQLSHYVTPQEASAKTYLGKLTNELNSAVAERQALAKDPANASSWFGTSKLAQAQAAEEKARQNLTAALAAEAGISQKMYPFITDH